VASTKRERELARRRAERQAARRAELEARRRHRRATLLKSLAALVVVGVAATVVALTYDGDKDKPEAAAGACTYNKEGKAAKPVTGLPPSAPAKSVGTQTATLTTNRGPITLSLNSTKAPCTVNSFTFLAAQKYFDGTSCHRLTTSGIFVLQCGDPSGTGQGGPGYQFADENLTAFGTTESVTYPKGTLAMANGGAGTNGSQFFLVYADSPLAPSYTPFGTITGGLDVLAAVAKGGSVAEASGNTKPKLPVTITKVTIS
jgi:peptidyl-prolyl cis-trans isomerase B (cyclophilin B)